MAHFSNFSSPPRTNGQDASSGQGIAAAAALAAQAAANFNSQHGFASGAPAGPQPQGGMGGMGGTPSRAGRPGEDRKIFIGGIPDGVNEDILNGHFGRFGQIENSIVMIDKATMRCRGFGFVTYTSIQEMEACLSGGPHILNGKNVDVKRSQEPKDRPQGGKGMDGGPSGGPRRNEDNPLKCFIGGLPQECDHERLQQHFSQYGTITDAIVIRDRESGRSKGFGFVTYESQASVEAAVNGNNQIDGKYVDVRNNNRSSGGGGQSGKGKGGGKGGWGGPPPQPGFGDSYGQPAGGFNQSPMGMPGGMPGAAPMGQDPYNPYAAYYNQQQTWMAAAAGQPQATPQGAADPYAAYYAAMQQAAFSQQQQQMGGGGASGGAQRSNPY